MAYFNSYINTDYAPKGHSIREQIVGDKSNLILLFLYTAVLLFFCSKMSPLYPVNEWADVNLYYNIGKCLMDGKVLYVDTFDHKGPVIFLIYGIGYLLSGTSFVGMYIIQVLCWTMMVYISYFTARMFLDKQYALLIALAFPLFLLLRTQMGGAAEEFILVAISVSSYYFICFFKEKAALHKPSVMMIHGIMCSIVFFTKLSLILFWVFPLLAIGITLILQKEYKNLFKNIGMFLLGFVIIALPIFIYLFINDAIQNAYHIYIELNREYANVTSDYILMRFYQRLRYSFVDFSFILLGAFVFPILYIRNNMGRLSFILSFISLFFIVNSSFNYSDYYAIPYYVFVTMGGIVVIGLLKKYVVLQMKWFISVFFAVVCIAIGISEKGYFDEDRAVLQRQEQPSGVIYQFSEVIKRENSPTLLNLGNDLGNGVFTKAGIHPSVKYFVTPNILYEAFPDMRNQQTAYIRNAEVQFVILATGSFNYDYFNTLPYLHQNYTLADTCADGNIIYSLYKRR